MTEENYWQAVLTRDSNANGKFVYAVRSTGIYCNPTCPSRRPGREQVIFFSLPVDAEQAGFRPCLRCHPQEQLLPEPHLALVQQACRYIKANLEGQLTLARLSEEVHLSPYHLQRVFKRVMGITPRQYAEACRVDQLKLRLKEGEPVTKALYEAGYNSSSSLYEQAPAQLGMTPTTYSRGGKNMHIRYTTVDCALGILLVAATEKGICAVSLGTSEAHLETALQHEYPLADLQRDSTDLQQWVHLLLKYLDGQEPHLELPLDVQATAFERRVWAELQAIPYGQTRSYGKIAQSLGQPTAARAVAQACAHNPVALVIPCHRVIREDGNPGGYRWGIERKQRLLAQEQNGSKPAKLTAQ